MQGLNLFCFFFGVIAKNGSHMWCAFGTLLPSGFRKFLLADATRPTTKNNGNGAGEPTDVQLLIGSLSDSAAFDWALECVLSRAFQLPPDTARRPSFGDGDADDVPTRAPEVQPPAPDDVRMALLPVIDSLNHYSRMPTTMYWEEDGKAISVAGK